MQATTASTLVSGILLSKDIMQEYDQVEELLMLMKESCWLREDSCRRSDSDDIESDFLANADTDNEETSMIPKDLLKSQLGLKQLVLYLFERRFGWSEQECCTGRNPSQNKQQAVAGSPYHRLRTVSLPYTEETRIKKMLNTKLDELINLFAAEEKLNSKLLDAYAFAIFEANSLPVVRSQLFCHILGWLALVINDETLISDEIFSLIKSIIIAGVSDVWSAIRNNTVSRITTFIEFLPLAHFEDIFLKFAALCDDVSSTWQAKEGAIMAMAGILQCFKLTIVQQSALQKDSSSSSGTVLCRKFGKHYFVSLPSFTSESLQKIVYNLFSNSQLSIKEHANRAFCSFLLRSEFSQVFNAFKEVLLYLANKAFCRSTKIMHEWKFAEADAVDGYIKAAEFLVKHVPVDYILHNWDLCFATFSHYLMHPASTVRQAASSTIKYLAAKQSQALVFAKLVTQHLVSGWKTNISLLMEPLSTHSTIFNSRSSVKRLEKYVNGGFDVTESWEWREGRLLAYELILKFLIANHIHYTFPAYTFTRNMQAKKSQEEHRKSVDVNSKFSTSHNFGSSKGKSFARHEALSRSLTMETDQVTQKFISSLAERGKGRNQTFSLLEIMKKSDELTTDNNFENLKETICEGEFKETSITMEAIRNLQEFREEHFSKFDILVRETDKVPFGKVLTQIFIQTLECLADTRWELRRMAHQVLPLISEAIRFYDAKLLENLWESHLSINASLLVFGACVSLRDSLAHIAKLVKYFENPPGFWKDIDRCRIAAKKIVDTINVKLPDLLTKVEEILDRRSFDRLTIISVEVLMLSVIHFPKEEMKRHMVAVVTAKVSKLFTFAYPSEPYAVHLKKSESDNSSKFESSTAVSLACAPKNLSPVARACKVQDVQFVELQRLLPAFFRAADFEDVVSILPIVLGEISSLIDAATDVQFLFQACHCLLNDAGISGCVLSTSVKEALEFSADQICCLIQSKDMENHFLRQFLDVLLAVIRILDKNANLKSVFVAIASKLASEGTSSASRSNEENYNEEHMKDYIEDEFLRICMLSNDIRRSPIDDMSLLTEDDQENSPRNLPESQAMGDIFDVNDKVVKSDDKHMTPPMQRSISPYDENYDSDWDSWEDEEETVSQVRHAFEVFLVNLKSILVSESLLASLQMCDVKDRKIVESLMSS